jgi:hypothetical protein
VIIEDDDDDDYSSDFEVAPTDNDLRASSQDTPLSSTLYERGFAFDPSITDHPSPGEHCDIEGDFSLEDEPGLPIEGLPALQTIHILPLALASYCAKRLQDQPIFIVLLPRSSKRQRGKRYKFTTDYDAKLVDLKENQGLSWKDIGV